MEKYKGHRPPGVIIPESKPIPILAPKPITPDAPITHCLACNKFIFERFQEEHNKSEIHKYFEGLKEKASNK